MSLDGYIAGPNGESDWIVIDPDMAKLELVNHRIHEKTWTVFLKYAPARAAARRRSARTKG